MNESAGRNEIMKIIGGFRATQVLSAAASLGIGDILKDGAQSLTAIARSAGVQETTLARLLEALVALDVLVRTDDGAFGLSETGEYLRQDHPASVRNFAVLMGTDWYWRPWEKMLASLRSGKSAFEECHGMAFFQYLENAEDAASTFNAAMTGSAKLAAESVCNIFDFSEVHSFADLGGGTGLVLGHILSEYPQMVGTLVELPTASSKARVDLQPFIEAGRACVLSQSFFENVPVGLDVYFLRHILHDWGDSHAIQLLKQVRAAMRNDSVLLIMERILEGETDELSTLADIEMMVMMSGGRERSEAQLGRLLEASKLRLCSVKATPSGRFLIEARPL